MKGVKKIIVFGATLAFILLLIDVTDAKKKEFKTKEAVSKNLEENSENERYENKGKHENTKKQNVKKSTKNIEEDLKTETKKYKLKKDTTYTTKKDSKQFNEETPKITKTYQKVKKYKVVENEPTHTFGSCKTKAKKTKQKVAKEETVDEIYKTVKKTSQTKLSEEENIKRVIEDVLHKSNGEEQFIYDEETSANPQKKRKYKLVQLVLEEDREEEKEGNETIVEVGSEDEELANFRRTEKEEVIEKIKMTHTVKKPRTIVEEDLNEDENTVEEYTDEGNSSDMERPASKYEDPDELPICKPLPEDPERKGPKKLTLYVIEEEVDGLVKKRVVSEEDGVSMCEVADLMKEQYFAGLN